MSDTEIHVKKFQKELSAGMVSLVLLAVLAKSDVPLYGYQIAKRLEQADESVLGGKQSAFYPVLRNLHEAGLLDSYVEPSISGPPRRYYQITEFGRTVFAEWKQTWQGTQRFVQTILEEATP